MTMKRTDLEKMQERKITGKRVGAVTPDRFGKQSTGDSDAARKPGGLMRALLDKADGDKTGQDKS